MRVLVLSHSSAVDNLGGAERAMIELLDDWRLMRPDLEVFVVARTPEGYLQPELDRRGIPWMVLPFQSWVRHRRLSGAGDVYNAAREDFGAVRALERLMQEFKPDLVVTNTIVAPWAAVAAKLVGVPHIWFAHEYGDDHEFSMPVADTFEDLGTLSDRIVTSSRALREYLSQWIDAEKISVLYPNLHLSQLEERLSQVENSFVQPFSSNEHALRVICVGRIAKSKGQWRLVRAIEAMKREGLPVEVVLVGSATPAYREEFIALVGDCDVAELVTFTGEVSNPMPYIAAADVGAVVSDSEGFGRATIEYMAAGKPVVGLRVGATVELIDEDESGLLVDPGDISELVDALERYWRDRELVATHGRSAIQTLSEDISSRHGLDELLPQLEEIAASGPAPLHRLPHLLLSWMTLPETVLGLLMESGSMVDPRTSRTWRVGELALAGPRTLRRVIRGRGRTR